MTLAEAAEFISNDLRLKTLPIAVKFLPDKSGFPEKTRQPSVTLGKKMTICQAVTLARLYGWTVGLTKADLICVPAMIAFGLTATSDQKGKLGKLFCQVDFSKDAEGAAGEIASMTMLDKGEAGAMVLAPLKRGWWSRIRWPYMGILHRSCAWCRRGSFRKERGFRATLAERSNAPSI